MTPQELYDGLEERCETIAWIDGDSNGEHRVGVLACDADVGIVLSVEVGLGADGRPAVALRSFDLEGVSVPLSVIEVDGQVMIST